MMICDCGESAASYSRNSFYLMVCRLSAVYCLLSVYCSAAPPLRTAPLLSAVHAAFVCYLVLLCAFRPKDAALTHPTKRMAFISPLAQPALYRLVRAARVCENAECKQSTLANSKSQTAPGLNEFIHFDFAPALLLLLLLLLPNGSPVVCKRAEDVGNSIWPGPLMKTS